MRWAELPPQLLSDDDYVAQVRGNLKLAERHRPWFVALYIALVIAAIYFSYIPVHKLIFYDTQIAVMIGNPIWPIIPGFFAGAAAGVIFTSVISIAVIYFIVVSRTDRSEQLLVRYYDEIHSSSAVRGSPETIEDSSG